jgi:hypothetical protein
MSSLSEPTGTYTSTYWTIRAVESATEIVTTLDTAPYTTYTTEQVYDSTPTAMTVVQVHGEIDIPLTCDDMYWFHHLGWDGVWRGEGFVPLVANPDIAGLGVSLISGTCEDSKALMHTKIILSFLITAFLVLLLAITAYVGGFLPCHYLRRADRLALHANSRNEDSRWREVLEGVILSYSDQQLVTGLAILVAGYYEMFNNNLSLYHWNIVVYLAWMSSAVHIASLTLLRDIFNRRPTLRNIRVAGMLALLALLVTAMLPLRKFHMPINTPARCLWGKRSWNFGSEGPEYFGDWAQLNWALSVTMLLVAYVWKLSQLFSSSRGWVRRWLVAEPQAATERLMRRALLSHRSKWLTLPAYFLLTYCHIIAIVYTEMAESFAAAIMYLCLALLWGVVCIISVRRDLPDTIKDDESTLTFGQLVPLFLLVLPGLSACGLFASE